MASSRSSQLSYSRVEATRYRAARFERRLARTRDFTKISEVAPSTSMNKAQ